MANLALRFRTITGLRVERVPAPFWVRVAIPFVAILVAFLLTSILVIMAGANPIEAFYYLLIEPLTSRGSETIPGAQRKMAPMSMASPGRGGLQAQL